LIHKKSFLGVLSLLFVFGCAAPDADMSTENGREAIIVTTNNLLSNNQCTDAVQTIEDLYDSTHVNNEIRLLRASAHGCVAGVNFLEVINDLTENEIAGSKLWETLAMMFPSTSLDQKVESSWYATDALLATLDSGAIVTDEQAVNSGTNNEGSLEPKDRTTDANLYLFLVSMSTIGALENRHGEPDSNYQKTTDLPWTTFEEVDTEGCSFAASVMNLFDSLGQVIADSSGDLNSSLETIEVIQEGLNWACRLGCAGVDYIEGVEDVEDGVDLDLSCTNKADENGWDCQNLECPIALRNRNGCADDDLVKCSAAGVVRFINNSESLGWNSGS